MPMSRIRRGAGGLYDSDEADGEDQSLAEDGETKERSAAVGKHDLGPSSVTLSGLLNAIDGVASQASLIINILCRVG